MTDVPMGDGLPEWAVAAVRNYCGWHIAPEVTETVRVYGEGTSVILLPSLKVQDVTQVMVDGREVFGYRWDTRGILYLRGRVAAHVPIDVTLTHGYKTIPADVKTALSKMDLTNGAMPFTYMNVDGVSVGRVGKPASASNTTGLDDVTALILSPYVRGPLL